MKIGVSGASGNLGRATLKELARRGPENQLVGISRTPHADGSVEARLGDYNDRSSLLEAYSGLDAVMPIPLPGGRGEHFKTAIDAAVEADVGHVLFLSSTGTREIAEPSMFAAYWEGEQHLVRHAPRWTILRMSYYAESFAQVAGMSLATGALVGIGEGRVAFVSRDDVAAAAAGILLGRGHAGAIYNATGPQAFNLAERAAVLSEASGRQVAPHILSADQLRQRMLGTQVPEPYVQPMIDIEGKFAEGGFDIVTGDVERLAGRAPRSVSEVLKQALENA